jgi:hypothetical protein
VCLESRSGYVAVRVEPIGADLGSDVPFVVMEVWISQDDQGLYMDTALGPPLGQASVPLPSRAIWVDLVAYHTPGS